VTIYSQTLSPKSNPNPQFQNGLISTLGWSGSPQPTSQNPIKMRKGTDLKTTGICRQGCRQQCIGAVDSPVDRSPAHQNPRAKAKIQIQVAVDRAVDNSTIGLSTALSTVLSTALSTATCHPAKSG
jgi:hypothetical protein